jgi:uncharacterized protein YcgI (DUF1989 family)
LPALLFGGAGRGVPKLSEDSFYRRLITKRSNFRLREKLLVPPNSGKGFKVKAGQAFRIVEVEGPQVGDIWFYNSRNPKEHFWSDTTYWLEGAYMKRFSRLWSNPPWLRPLAVVLEESVATRLGTPQGFRHNGILGAHCTSEHWELFTGAKNHNSCYMNALQAITPFGLGENDIHDNMNIHMKVKTDPKTGNQLTDKCMCKKGDYIEYFAEMDLLVAVSVCPTGDMAVPMEDLDNITLRPLGIEIYDTGVKPKPFRAWHDWRPAFRKKLASQ